MRHVQREWLLLQLGQWSLDLALNILEAFTNRDAMLICLTQPKFGLCKSYQLLFETFVKFPL
jgi:hypothetical protein